MNEIKVRNLSFYSMCLHTLARNAFETPTHKCLMLCFLAFLAMIVNGSQIKQTMNIFFFQIKHACQTCTVLVLRKEMTNLWLSTCLLLRILISSELHRSQLCLMAPKSSVQLLQHLTGFWWWFKPSPLLQQLLSSPNYTQPGRMLGVILLLLMKTSVGQCLKRTKCLCQYGAVSMLIEDVLHQLHLHASLMF